MDWMAFCETLKKKKKKLARTEKFDKKFTYM